jgi:hypothetical protein
MRREWERRKIREREGVEKGRSKDEDLPMHCWSRNAKFDQRFLDAFVQGVLVETPDGHFLMSPIGRIGRSNRLIQLRTRVSELIEQALRYWQVLNMEIDIKLELIT